MTKIVCRKHGRALIPVDQDGLELFAKLKEDRDVMVEIKIARNPRFHRLFFAICGFVKMHSPLMCDRTIAEIKDSLKLATGYVTRYVDEDTAQTFLVCKSIAWESCDQLEFNRFFDAACQVVANRWMPAGVTPEDVRRELILMCDGEHAVDRRSA